VRHALPRLFAPRHPPVALGSLTFFQIVFLGRKNPFTIRSAVFKVPAPRALPSGGAPRVLQAFLRRCKKGDVEMRGDEEIVPQNDLSPHLLRSPHLPSYTVERESLKTEQWQGSEEPARSGTDRIDLGSKLPLGSIP
jgi:hypothetical protein